MRSRIIRFAFSTETPSVASPVQVKRFYKIATVEQAFQSANPMHQWLVKLDGKSVKTPSRHILALPSPQLASFIAHEFNMQKDVLRPSTMPLLTMARNATDIDHDDRIREFMERSIVNYLERDTLLYREEIGSKLHKRQSELLDPEVEKFNQRFQMLLKLNYGLEVNPLRIQDKLRLEGLVSGLNTWQIVSLDQLVDNLKSCILALQVWDNQMSVEKAAKLSRLEEDFQIEKFGKIEGHHDFDENTVLMNASAAKLFSQLIMTQSINF